MPHIKGSEGIAFQLGNTGFYIGPRQQVPNDRHLKRPPVLSMWRLEPGKEIDPQIVAEFPNSTMAEEAIEWFIAGINEGTASKPLFEIGQATPCGMVQPLETPVGDIAMVCELSREHVDPESPLWDAEHSAPVGLPDGSQYVGRWPVELVEPKARHRAAKIEVAS